MFFRIERHFFGSELSGVGGYWLKASRFIRSVIFYAFIGMLCVASSLLILPLALLGLQSLAMQVNRCWAGLFLKAGRLICGLAYQVKGFEHLADDQAVVFLARHESAWETIALQYFLPRSVIVFKRSLLWVPFFGLNLLALQFIPVSRKRSVQAFKTVMRQGSVQLKRGMSVVFFPEGRRVEPMAFPAFYRAGAHLAKTNQVKVIPICHNAGDYWGRNQFVKRPGTIEVVIGPALVATDTMSTNQCAYNWIQATRLSIGHL